MIKISQKIQTTFNWGKIGDQKSIAKKIYCPTRDVFQARIEKLPTILKDNFQNEQLVFLLVAVIGEIGNNAFDHNLGNWLDAPGVYLDLDLPSRLVAIADRGQGVLRTIQRVKPEIKNHDEAIKVAFTEMISGRFPERRGNGLKFVRTVIQKNTWELNFYSGDSLGVVDGGGLKIKTISEKISGVVAIIKF